MHQDTEGAPPSPKSGGAPAKGGNSKDKPKRSSQVGRALRSVYDDTLRESVPDDFMDLLGKLS